VRTVVVLDDNPNTRKLVMMTLGENFRYLEGTDATYGIGLILKELPAVVIVSQNIGGTSGVDVCKAIKKVHGLANIPFILLFEEQKPKDAELAEVGIDGAVPKKLLTRFLKDEVKKCLNPRQVSSTVSWIDAQKMPVDADVGSEQPRAEAHFSANSLQSVNPLQFHKKADVTKLPDQMLADSAHVEKKDAGSASPTSHKAEPHFKSEPSHETISVKSDRPTSSDYHDPVKSFLEDGTVDYVYPAQKKTAQEQPKHVEHAVAHKPLPEHAAVSKQEQTGQISAHDAEISTAVRKAIIEAIKETIPLFKDQLVAALEERLKGLK